MSTQLSATVGNSSRLYLRWTGDDVSGSGSRDEFGLDNITVSAVPEPGAVLFGGLVCGVIGVAVVARKLLGCGQLDVSSV
jgi:hypothetical protein